MRSLEQARRTAHGWTGIALAAAVMLAGAGFGAHAAAHTSDDPHQTTAQSTADRLLAAFVPPPGARSTGRPDPVPPHLAGPQVQSSNPNREQAIGWYLTTQTPDQVLTWVRSHPPTGTRLSGRGSSSTGSSFLMFTDPATPDDNRLLITPESAADGRTVIRLDATADWTPTRSPDTLIPARSVQALRIFTLSLGQPMHPLPKTETDTLETKDPATIRKIVDILNGLPPQTGGVHSCPADLGTRVHVLLDGYGEADLNPQGCGGVRLTVGNRQQPILLATTSTVAAQLYAVFGVTWQP